MKLPVFATAFLFALSTCLTVNADQPVAEATAEVDVFGVGTLMVPAEFKPAPRQSRIIEHEFAVIEGEGEDAPTARLTMMRSGGGVTANLDRWKGQFSGTEKKVGETEVTETGKLTVHTIKINGSYMETMGGGPFSGGKKVKREDYAMLGAILVEPKGAQYYVKMIGPASVIDANEKAFNKMVKAAGK